MAELREKVARMKAPQDLWRIEDYLRTRRKEIDDRYDFRYGVLIFVFAGLYREGFITDADIHGLSPDKIEDIKRMSEPFPPSD